MKRFALSLDGGGMRGLLIAILLQRLEEITGKPCWQMFSIIGGTSIGAIIGCLLSVGIPAKDVVEFFTGKDAQAIFGHPVIFGQGGILRPRYSEVYIEAVLQGRLGKATLADVKTQLIVTAFDISRGNPIVFKSHDMQPPFPLWQLARASSAAQSYFPAFKMADFILWDGGNIANNPAMSVYSRTAAQWFDDEITILSMGTGDCSSDPKSYNPNMGILEVAGIMVGHAIDTAPKLVDDQLIDLMQGREKYLRLQAKLDLPVALDDVSAGGIMKLMTIGKDSLVHSEAALQSLAQSMSEITEHVP